MASEPLRIAMVSPLEMRVPPLAYGGTELIVSLLTEELVRRGHEVTLFATGDAVTRAKLVSVCPKFLRGSGRDVATLTMLSVRACLDRAANFDIIHNHTLLEGMVTAGLVPTPVLTTLHGAVCGDARLLFDAYQGWHCTISDSAKPLLPPKDRFAGTAYNAIDTESYPFNDGEREDYLLFLSRISQEKGPHLAIEAARRLNMRLVIAGNVNAPDRPFFETRVQPYIDGDLIQYIGEADVATKKQLLCEARCLLAPIIWNEPFGLFLAEAMACGMPVIVFNRGAAPEVVQDGVTGFVVDTLEEMVASVARTRDIDPAVCRRSVEERFSVGRMTDEYLAAYRLVLEQARDGAPQYAAPFQANVNGHGQAPIETTVEMESVEASGIAPETR